MVELKSWFLVMTLVSGVLLVTGDDHADIIALKGSVAHQGQQIKSLDSTITVLGVSVSGLEKTVDAEGKQLSQLKRDVDVGKIERAKLGTDLDAEVNERTDAVAELVQKMTEEKENASRRMENLEKKLLEQITLSSERYDQVTELLRNESRRSEVLEQRLKAEEEKSASLQKELEKQDGVMSKIQESQSALAKHVDELFEFLPNTTFPNGSSVIHRKLETLNKIVTEEAQTVVQLRSDVDADSEKLSSVSGQVKSLNGSIDVLAIHDQNMDKVIKTIQDTQKKDLEKFHHEQFGFRYTGRGWSYSKYGEASKKGGVTLQDCLKFCQVKRRINPQYDGVNFYAFSDSYHMCQCTKGAYGFNPNVKAMRFLA